MQSARRGNNPAHLPRLQRESRVLKLLLHVASPEVAEIAPLPGAGAVRLRLGQVAQAGLAALDGLLVALEHVPGFLFGAGDGGLYRGEKAKG